jgi:hypothetical protein
MQIYNLLTHHGSFALDNGYNTTHFTPVEYKLCLSSLDNRYKALREKTKSNKLQDNSIVYFSPFTEFPLYKFKNYIEESKLNITRSTKYNNINTVILNDNIIKKLFNVDNTTSYNFGKYYIIDKNFYNNNIKSLISVKQYGRDVNVEINQDYVLFADRHLSNIKSNIKLDIEKLPVIEGRTIGTNWGSNKAFQYYELFEKIIEEYEQGNINIVFDDQINNEANSGLEFDEDLFSTLLDMVANNDEGNINIARELIASTNLEQAKPYVLYLFHLYPQLSRQNNTRSWKYVVDQFKEDKNRICYDHLQLFINAFGLKYPEYIPTIFKLMAVYFNKQWKNEIIKEITIL